MGLDLWGQGWVFCAQAATEACAGCQCSSWVLVGFGDEELGKTQVAGIMNMNTYGIKASEIYTVVMVVLAINFINGESCWVYLQSRSLRTVIPPAR